MSTFVKMGWEGKWKTRVGPKSVETEEQEVSHWCLQQGQPPELEDMGDIGMCDKSSQWSALVLVSSLKSVA